MYPYYLTITPEIKVCDVMDMSENIKINMNVLPYYIKVVLWWLMVMLC